MRNRPSYQIQQDTPKIRKPIRKILLVCCLIFGAFSGYKYHTTKTFLDEAFSNHLKRFGYSMSYDYIVPWPWHAVTIRNAKFNSQMNRATPFLQIEQLIASDLKSKTTNEHIKFTLVGAKLNLDVFSKAAKQYNNLAYHLHYELDPLQEYLTAPVTFAFHQDFIQRLFYSNEYSGLFDSLGKGTYIVELDLDKRFNSFTVDLDANVNNLYQSQVQLKFGFENSAVPYKPWDELYRSTVLLEMHLNYLDDGFYTLFTELLAEKLARPTDQVSTMALTALTQAIALNKISLWPYLKKVTDEFIAAPISYKLKATPETPITLRELELYKHKDLPAVLNVDVDL